jgi:hypothetical protein
MAMRGKLPALLPCGEGGRDRDVSFAPGNFPNNMPIEATGGLDLRPASGRRPIFDQKPARRQGRHGHRKMH